MSAAAVVKSPATRKIAALLVLSLAGVASITRNEGVSRQVYLDPVGIPTVCAGHTGADVPKVGTVVTEDYCAAVLASDTTFAQAGVRKYVKVQITQRQYDALVDFTFNVGVSNLAQSTFLKKINAGDCKGAGAELPRWNRAKGKVLPGLTARRAWEREEWESGC